MIGGLAALTTLAAGQPAPDPPDRADRVWAAGYAAAAAHECPTWTVDDQTVLNQQAAAIKIDPKSGPSLDTAMLPLFKSGGLSAQSQAIRVANFCAAPATHATRAQNWVLRFMQHR